MVPSFFGQNRKKPNLNINLQILKTQNQYMHDNGQVALPRFLKTNQAAQPTFIVLAVAGLAAPPKLKADSIYDLIHDFEEFLASGNTN